MTEREFSKLRVGKKYEVVEKEGEFIASRMFQSYNVHLFQVADFHVEVWTWVALGQVRWIEILKNPAAMEEYADKLGFDPGKELGNDDNNDDET